MIIIFNFHKQTVQVRGSRKRICEKLKAAKIINQNAVKFAAFRGELGCELGRECALQFASDDLFTARFQAHLVACLPSGTD